MRAISASQDTVLLTSARSTWAKVEIFKPIAATWVDLGMLLGRDWVESVSITDSIDAPTSVARVVLKRNVYFDNLSPLNLSSQINELEILVQVNRQIRISVAVMPRDVPAAASDYVLIFRGRIDQLSFPGDQITLDCRDEGGVLIDTFVETTIGYGSSVGVQIETASQGILSSALAFPPAGTGVTLFSLNGVVGFLAGDSPGWAIRPQKLDKVPCLDFLRTLWAQIGWVVRYKYQVNAADFKLVAYNPPRAAPAVARTFTQSQWIALNQFDITTVDVRNVVELYYRDTKGNITTTGPVPDAASIAKYGRKYMQLAEQNGSQLNTPTEAAAMVAGALSDLKEPTAIMGVEMPLFWPVEINDYYTFSANASHFGAAQSLAVTGFTHTISGDSGRTVMTLRGKPTAGANLWLYAEADQPTTQWGTKNFDTLTQRDGNCAYNGDFAHWSDK